MRKTDAKDLESFPEILTGPWFYFLIFTISGTLLSYFPLHLEAKLWIGLAGVVIPLGIGLFALKIPAKENGNLQTLDVLSSLSPWYFWAIASGSVLVRLYILLTNPWPVPDDGLFAFPSLELSKLWEWHFCFTVGQHPPLFNWMLALFFKIIPPSLYSMRSFLFLLSVAPPVLVYFSCRRLFSKSIAFFSFLFCSFGFWPLYTSRFCINIPLLLLVQLMALWSLGQFWLAESPKRLTRTALWLGFWTGLGFWVGIPWPLAALLIALAFFGKLTLIPPRLKKGLPYYFLVPALVSCLCYFYFSLLDGNGSHVKELLLSTSGKIEPERLIDGLSNWTALFWGCDRQNSYGPSWGGMLNPIEGSLFLLGSLRLLSQRRSGLSLWLVVSFLVCMSPGTLTYAFEIFRDSLAIPFLFLFCGLGAQTLFTKISRSKRGWGVAALVISLVPLNLFHLSKTFEKKAPLRGVSGFTESQTFQRAFELLDGFRKRMGPGILLLDLSPNYGNQTLAVATYGFNSSENPRFDPAHSTWAAFIENGYYLPFLKRRFPSGQWFIIGPDSFWSEGGLLLGVIPIDGTNRKVFARWLAYDHRIHKVNREIFFDHAKAHSDATFQELLSSEPLLGGDPLLESVFYERLLFQSRYVSTPMERLDWLQHSVSQGYPLDELLNAESVQLQSLGRPREAKKIREELGKAPLDRMTPMGKRGR